MAREITIIDNFTAIQITYAQDYPSAASATSNIAKSNIVAVEMVDTDTVALVQYEERPNILLNYAEVIVPVVASGAELYTALITMWLNVPGATIYTQTDTFVDADLVANVLTVTHLYATETVFLVLYNPSGGVETGYLPVVVDDATVTVDFGGSIGVGTWTYLLVAVA